MERVFSASLQAHRSVEENGKGFRCLARGYSSLYREGAALDSLQAVTERCM